MSLEFPDWINPWVAAQGRRIIGGTMPLARLARLAELLETVEGEAHFELSLMLDSDGRPVGSLEVSAPLVLMCQASMKPYTERVARQGTLVFVEDDAEIPLLPESYEPVVLENHRVAMMQLVEDELILGLPQVPRNPELESVSYSTGGAAEEAEPVSGRRNPFAELQGKFGNAAEDVEKK